MEPRPFFYQKGGTESAIDIQLARYRYALPEVDRSSGHSFFKEVNKIQANYIRVSIGYRVGIVPPSLLTLYTQIINIIESYNEASFRISLQNNELWITSELFSTAQDFESTTYLIEEANLNWSLSKAREILETRLLAHVQPSTNVLYLLRDEILPLLSAIFTNPDLD